MHLVRQFLCLCTGSIFLLAADATAQSLPATVNVAGTVSAGTALPGVIPQANDQVLIVNASTKKVEGIATVADATGAFIAAVSKTSEFNSTVLTLQYKRGNTVYTLLGSDNQPISFPFAGGLFPTTVSFSVVIGTVVSGGTTTPDPSTGGGSTPTPGTATGGSCTDPKMDVNGDGACDQADIDLIKQFIGGVNRTIGRKADVNGDGVVNTRDVIDAIRAKNSQQRRGSNPLGGSSSTTTTTPTTTTGTTTTTQ
jgi:hypothetical protein